MSVLVAYATRHGSTRGIAEGIAERLRSHGVRAEALPASRVRDPGGYDAVIVGSALYMYHWLAEAARFVKRNRRALAGRPVWLFSSGPLGTETIDAEGRDVRETAGPRELGELLSASGARGHRIFFGAWSRDAKPAGFMERLAFLFPAARAAMPDGDFRDWPEIDAWADGIAAELGHERG